MDKATRLRKNVKSINNRAMDRGDFHLTVTSSKVYHGVVKALYRPIKQQKQTKPSRMKMDSNENRLQAIRLMNRHENETKTRCA